MAENHYRNVPEDRSYRLLQLHALRLPSSRTMKRKAALGT